MPHRRVLRSRNNGRPRLLFLSRRLHHEEPHLRRRVRGGLVPGTRHLNLRRSVYSRSQDKLTLPVCDSACKTCAGEPGFCLTCSSGSAHNGTCVDSCPERTYATNGTCAQCSLDCLTCSGSSAADCATCPPSRPLLQDGRCLPYCPPGFYAAGSTCEACDKSCATCTSGASCTSCRRGFVLKAGACVAVTCLFAQPLGMCLSGFIDHTAECTTSTTPPTPSAALQSKSQSSDASLAPLAALAVLPLLVLLAWYIRRQRRQTRERTAEFAHQLDNHAVGKRLDALAVEEELQGNKRRGLRDLWLKDKAREAQPRSHGTGQSRRETSTTAGTTHSWPESVHMQDFSKRASYDEEIGQDPGPAMPSQATRASPSASSCQPSTGGLDPFAARSEAATANPPGAPKASLDLTNLWPNMPSRPNAL